MPYGQGTPAATGWSASFSMAGGHFTINASMNPEWESTEEIGDALFQSFVDAVTSDPQFVLSDAWKLINTSSPLTLTPVEEPEEGGDPE